MDDSARCQPFHFLGKYAVNFGDFAARKRPAATRSHFVTLTLT
jgi:hypothetical protein